MTDGNLNELKELTKMVSLLYAKMEGVERFHDLQRTFENFEGMLRRIEGKLDSAIYRIDNLEKQIQRL